MAEIKWLHREFIFAAHRAQLNQHGGSDGLRDEGLLESALARPVNLAAYEEDVSTQAFAAAYLFGIAKNHPFVDGNKRVAYTAAEAFLILNGLTVTASQLEKYEMVIRVASGQTEESEVFDWLKTHTQLAK
ncbi:MAG: type II toxin-antitoxin system death-on-curing family toxin [Thermoleophilaceae bacterium]|nr:type II toxin-antitoxin system death-on-curing family toxin [Thermoleophilaceae bacterium]